MSEPLSPSAALLCKLGSIIVHAEEGLSIDGSEFDLAAFRSLVEDPEVLAWLKAMDDLALLPVKR